MIIKDGTEQWIGCTLCGDKMELSREDAANPLTVLMHLQAMRIEHKPCDEFALNPHQAKIERVWRVRMRVELASLSPLPSGPARPGLGACLTSP